MQDSWLVTYARVGFAGKSPIAPGTAGSFVALLCAPLLFIPLSFPARLVLLAFLFWTGMHASTKAEQILGKQDPKEVVIDEFVGQWLTFLPFADLTVWGYLAGFALFRLFDITKPWPIRNSERLAHGLGIMMDDVLAGLYAMLGLALLIWIL